MEDKITLDINAFKVLASETRIALLKKLGEKKRSPSSLADDMHVSVQAVTEQLERLREAGLVERVDEGRKWKYYELTDKGKRIIHPNEKPTAILLVLGLFVLVALATVLFTQPNTVAQPIPAGPQFLQPAFSEKAIIAGDARGGAPAAQTAPETLTAPETGTEAMAPQGTAPGALAASGAAPEAQAEPLMQDAYQKGVPAPAANASNSTAG